MLSSSVLVLTCFTIAGAQDAASNLLQLNQQKQTHLGEGSAAKSLAEGKAAKSLASIKSLAEKVASGKTKISDDTKTALSAIHDLMETVKSDVAKDKDANQKLIDQARDNLAACATSEMPSPGAKDTNKDTHETCRSEEHDLATEKSTACGTYDSAQQALQLARPACACGDTLITPECLSTLTAFSTGNEATFTNQRDACTSATTGNDNKKTECDTAQATFESSFCSYRAAVNGACDDQETCKTQHEQSRTDTETSVRASEEAFKSEFVAAETVLCYVTALEGESSTVKVEVDKCASKVVDTSTLSITYHDAPEVAECSRDDVQIYPGQTDWVSTNYDGHPWVDLVTTVTACS